MAFIQKLDQLSLSFAPQSFLIYRGLNGEKVLGSARRVRGVQWTVVVELPLAEVYAPVRQMISVMALTLLVCITIAIILGFSWSKSIISPLHNLTVAAAKISAGNFDNRVNITSNNELGKLANSFNYMASQLEEYFQILESKNKKLKDLDSLKNEFLTNTSHELRTPLNGIIGIAESLVDGATGTLPPQTCTNLRAIAASGKRLSTLVNDILDFSQLKHKDLKLQLRAVGVREITEIVLSATRLLIGNKDLQLKNNICADLPPVLADENRLQQILYNLVGNAIKFTDSGEVEVSAQLVTQDGVKSRGEERRKSDYLAISVQDTGIGIPEDKLDRIFASFEQADGSTARIYGGTGLGLAITKKLVELHGGSIKVESTLGVGSTFTFALPVCQQGVQELDLIESTSTRSPALFVASPSNRIEPARLDRQRDRRHKLLPNPTQTSAALPENESQRKQWHILIVDDDFVNLRVLNNYLYLCKYQVTQASSGQEALALLTEGCQPDLIILDVMMPGMTGYEVTKTIREKWKRDELPVVLLTAKNRLEDEVVGLKVGANDYLTKPIVKEQLLARIETQLALRQESYQRQQAQAAWYASEQKLAEFLEAVPVGVGVITAQGTLKYLNHKAQELLGQGLVPGVTAQEFPEIYQLYLAGSDLLYPVEKLLAVRALKGESASSDDLEIHLQNKIIPIEAWGTPVFDREGKITYSIVAFQDISERKQAEAERIKFTRELETKNLALKSARATLARQNRHLEQLVAQRTATLSESQRTLSTLMSNLPGMAYRSRNDRNWSMLFVSEGCFSLTGYHSEDLTSKQLVQYGQLIHPEDRNYLWDQIQVALKARQPFQIIYRLLLSKSERVKWVWEQGRGIFNANGQLEFIEGFITDISDRIYFEQKLERSNQDLQQTIQQLQATQGQLKVAKEKSEAASRAKSTFLANMSHELRTPLNSIIGFAQLLNRDSSLQPSQQQRIEIINRSGEYLLSLINSILDISKIEAGKNTLNENDFDLYGMLYDVKNMFEPKTKQKGIELFLELNPNVPQFIYADEGKLRQVLINLIANGVKFTEKGSVSLKIRAGSREGDLAENQLLYFEVRDTGLGIAAEELKKLFVPFEQTASSRSVKQGTGLGLSLSQKYIQLMGGEISVQSTVVVGTCFQFQIPIRSCSTLVNVSERPKDKVIGLAPLQPDYRILIVDDLADNRQLLSSLLTLVGFLVKEASNGIEAVEISQDWHPHLIWMDLRMPKMDGYEAMRQIRAIQAQHTPDSNSSAEILNSVIIALTASALTEEREKILASGFDGYVFKPFQESVIWSTLTQFLGVEFIYQEEHPKMSKGMGRKNEPLVPLAPPALSEMPSQWLRELYQAASQLKGKRVLELIAEMEPDRPDLAQQLRDLAQNYQFERIIELIPPSCLN